MGKLSWQRLGRDSLLHLDPSKASALPKCLCPNLRSDVCWHLMIRAEDSFAVLLARQSFLLGGGTGSLHWLGEEWVLEKQRWRKGREREVTGSNPPFSSVCAGLLGGISSSTVFSPWEALGWLGGFAYVPSGLSGCSKRSPL